MIVHIGGVVWIKNARELGLYIRDRRRKLNRTQSALAADARVSRRWLAALEAGKATAEVGLVLQTLEALEVELDLRPRSAEPDGIDLDAVLGEFAVDQ